MTEWFSGSVLQAHSIAALFGVRTFQSEHPERFHERFHLTELSKGPEAGILTLHGDMLVSHSGCWTKRKEKKRKEKKRKEKKRKEKKRKEKKRKEKRGGGKTTMPFGVSLNEKPRVIPQ